MTGAKSIEALGVVFTAGILAGTAVSAGVAGILAAGLLPLLTLPILLRERLRRMADGPAVSIVLLSFLLLGFFCAVLRSLPVMESPSAIRIFAHRPSAFSAPAEPPTCWPFPACTWASSTFFSTS